MVSNPDIGDTQKFPVQTPPQAIYHSIIECLFASKCGQTGAKTPVSKYHHQRTNSFQPRVEMSAFKYTLHSKATPRKGVQIRDFLEEQ